MLVRYYRSEVIEQDMPVVDLDTDQTAYTGSCIVDEVDQEYAPGDGVQVDAGSTQVPNSAPATATGR